MSRRVGEECRRDFGSLPVSRPLFHFTIFCLLTLVPYSAHIVFHVRLFRLPFMFFCFFFSCVHVCHFYRCTYNCTSANTIYIFPTLAHFCQQQPSNWFYPFFLMVLYCIFCIFFFYLYTSPGLIILRLCFPPFVPRQVEEPLRTWPLEGERGRNFALLARAKLGVTK